MTETTSTDAAVEAALQALLDGLPTNPKYLSGSRDIARKNALLLIQAAEQRGREQAEAAAAGLRGALERLADWHGRINAVEFAAKYPELSRQLDSLAREYPEGNYSEAELQALGVAAALDATQGAGLVAELEALKALRDAVAKMPADKTPLDVYEAWSTADEYESVRKEAQ